MRDINRINKFCNELAIIWETKCPDWRFGQLIENVFGNIESIFYIEEDEAIQKIKDYFNI